MQKFNAGIVAHHIYHTEAIIFGGHMSGEGDRVLYCYTRELGMVIAIAKSVREYRSKLRYALQTFAHADIDLVRGKNGWKLISARPIASFSDLWRNPKKRHILARYLLLARRLIQGEERHSSLFDDMLSGFVFLRDRCTEDVLFDTEILLVVRLLHELGYWREEEKSEPLLCAGELSLESIHCARAMRPLLLQRVNSALASSHL